ncbi:MAG: heparinase II/III family protein [Porphyromonadaceae bacterium]|nr:heparinase II/III family protein [Porphyromonadaceae bacterium]
MEKCKFSLFIIIILCFSQLSAQEILPVFEKKKEAEIGAMPCRYETVSRPSVMITGEQISLVKKEIAQKGSEKRKIYLQYIKANADFWLDRPVEVPETGGWMHDFYCSDGTKLDIPDDKIFNDEIPSRCSVCGKTYLNEKILAARRALRHYWNCGVTRDMALVYSMEGEEKYAEKAAEILKAYADAYPKQTTILRQTLDEAVVLIPLAESYDLIYDYLTEKERLYIRDNLFWPAAEKLTKSRLTGNWGSWHLSAIGVIGYATRHQRFIEYATKAFKDQMADQLGYDGLWPESVHTYHFYPLSGFLSFVEAAKNHGDDLYLWETKDGKGIKKMLTAPLRYVYPDMRIAAINDGWFDSFLPQDQYTVGFHYYHLPEFAWAVQSINKRGKSGVPGDILDPHYRNLLYGEKYPGKIKKTTFESINFPVLGIAILRQGSQLPENKEMMMTYDYGPFLSHGHPDKMGITLFAKGKLLVGDYGTTGYGSPASEFLRSTPSHNTIIIDGKNHPKTDDQHLTAFVDNKFFKLATATTDQIEPGVNWTRTVILLDDYIVLHDRVKGDKKHQYDWFFHAEGDSLMTNATPQLQDSDEFNYSFLTEIKKWDFLNKPGYLQWDCGEYGFGLWFSQNDLEQRIYSAKMPTGEGKKMLPLLVLRQKKPDAEFIAVLKPMKGKKEKNNNDRVSFLQDVDDQWIIQISHGKKKDQINLGKNGIVYMKNGELVAQHTY